MFDKFTAGIDLFRKGSEVANVEKWKNGGITVAAVGAAILALNKAGSTFFGISIDLTAEQATNLATGIIAVVGILLPLITSKRVGILPAKAGNNAPIEDHSGIDGVPAVAETAAPAYVQPVDTTPAIYDSENPLAGLDTTYRG